MARTLSQFESIVGRPDQISEFDARKILIDLCHQMGFNIVKEETPDYTNYQLVEEREFYGG